MLMILYVLALSFLIAGVLVMGLEIYRLFRSRSKFTQDMEHPHKKISYLEGDILEIRRVTQKYDGKIRVSVRMGKGRIKSLSDVYELEKDIYFPEP